MHRYITIAVFMMMPLALAATLQAEDAPVEAPAEMGHHAPAVDQAQWARQAAIAEAIVDLLSQIKALPTGPQGRVGDVLGPGEPILLAVMLAELPADAMQSDDAITLQATPQQVLQWMTQVQADTRAGEAIKTIDVNAIALDGPLSSTASLTLPEGVVVSPLVTIRNRRTPLPEPPLWKEHVTGQGRLLAERAARDDALRRLAAHVRTLAVSETLSVGEMIAQSTQPDIDITEFLRGADFIGLRCREDALVFEVVMQASSRPTLASFAAWIETNYAGESKDLLALRQAVERAPDRAFRETGSAMPPKENILGLPPETLVRLNAVTGQAVPLWATATYQAQAPAASTDATAGVVADLLVRAWAAPMPPQGMLGEVATASPRVLKALTFATLLRDKAVQPETPETPKMLCDTLDMQPAWRLIAAQVLKEGLLPHMKQAVAPSTTPPAEATEEATVDGASMKD
jgi:hypothetical protein